MGYTANGIAYKVHLDGYDQSAFLRGVSGTAANNNGAKSARDKFFYTDDDGLLVAMRQGDFKYVFAEQRKEGTMGVWAEPFTKLRLQKIFNLFQDPFERADITSNTFWEMDTLEKPSAATRDMIRIPGGTFCMGSDRHYPEEAPAHTVTVDGFWIDAAPVTNAQFRAFVEATGYVTWAEIPPDPKDYPGAKPNMLKAGGLVFTPPNRDVDLQRLESVVALHLRCDLAAALRQGQPHRRARRSPGGADRLS